MAKFNEHTLLARRREQWFKRLSAEYKYCTGTTFFITLTYEDHFLPVEFDGDDLVAVRASVRDCQLFMKKLRRYYVDRLGKVRYFLVSEFGDLTDRPHYHMLLFTEKKCTQAFMYDVLFNCWRNGYIIDCQYLKGPQGIRYVCKYIGKQFGDLRTFCLMSRRPGIGSSYLLKFYNYHRYGSARQVICKGCKSCTFELYQGQQKPVYTCIESCQKLREQVDQLRKRDFNVLSMTNISGSSKVRPPLPRYYREKLYAPQERTLMFYLKIQEDDEFFHSLPISHQVRLRAARISGPVVREMVCKKRDFEFNRKSLFIVPPSKI